MEDIRLAPTTLNRDIDIINKKIHELIDPRIYMICNYENSIYAPVSADGIFSSLIMELYKVLIDVNPIIKRLDFIVFGETISNKEWTVRITDHLDNGDHVKAERLFYHLKSVGKLRSIYGHNNNELNGPYELDNIEFAYIWNRNCFINANKCGEYTGSIKNTPDSGDDYKILIDFGLLPLWNECKAILNDIIDFISESDKKNEIVTRWIDEICQNYSMNPKYFRGQLASLVRIYTGIGCTSYNSYVEECYKSLPTYNARFILKSIYQQYKDSEDEVYRGKCIICRDSIIGKCQKRIDEIKRSSVKNNGETDYEKYFLRNILPIMLKNEIAKMSVGMGVFVPEGYENEDDSVFEIWRTGKSIKRQLYSLLPHELLQEIAYQCYEKVVDEVCGIVDSTELPIEWTIGEAD